MNADPAAELLTYRQAREAPCLACATSPCCTYLLLRDFQLDTIMDVDYALFLLNFEGIVLGLQPDRKIDVYLYQPCGHLDVRSGMCTVHSTKLQPAVCIHYKSHTCSYRQVFTTDLHGDKPLLDHTRMEWLADRIAFDDERRIAGFPAWSDVLEGFATMPTDRRPAPPPDPDPMVEEWRSIVLSQKAPVSGESDSDSGEGPGDAREGPGQFHHFGDSEVSDPCTGCGAWCCKMLVFDRGLPSDAAQLEFLRYCLGFPGVEIGVAADSWAVIVKSTCRHLVGNRCSVFGTDARPLKCDYYDAMSCAYRGHFGVPRPADVVRVTLRQFAPMAESIVFDELGRIVAIPPVQVLRDRLESAERAAAGLTGAPRG